MEVSWHSEVLESWSSGLGESETFFRWNFTDIVQKSWHLGVRGEGNNGENIFTLIYIDKKKKTNTKKHILHRSFWALCKNKLFFFFYQSRLPGVGWGNNMRNRSYLLHLCWNWKSLSQARTTESETFFDIFQNRVCENWELVGCGLKVDQN
jgi:hypothetical protein